MTPTLLFIGEPMDVEVDALQVRRTLAYVNSLSLTFAFYEYAVDAAGNAKPGTAISVSGSTGNLTYTAASDGDYYGQILPTAALTAVLVAGRKYIVKISNGLTGATAVDRNIVVVAAYRNDT